MTTSNRSQSLFASVARDRPEWLAQGVFAYALGHDQGVRHLVLRKVMPAKARPIAATVPTVERERPVGRWRADVVATWPGREPLQFELKLGAGLTWRQGQLLRRRRAVIIHPKGKRPAGLDGLTHISWSDLAAAAKDPVLKTLLGQADASSSWWQEELREDVLREEFESFMKKGSWPTMYCFLGTVDAHLRDLIGTSYKPSRTFAFSRASKPYYGFAFTLGAKRKKWFFVDLTQIQGKRGATLSLNPAGDDLLNYAAFPLKARTLARRVAAQVEKAVENGSI
jgi:hypothetical protein